MRFGWRKWRGLFEAHRQYEEIAEELELHLELRARKLRASGLTQEEANTAARKRLGRTISIQEDCRAAWGATWLDGFRQDASYAFRMLRRNWVFSTAAVLTLTLGIAANAAVFAFIDALILRPLPIHNPQSLVMLTLHEWQEGRDLSSISYPAFEQMAQRLNSVQGLFTWNESQLTLGWGSGAHTLVAGVASGAYYQTLGVNPLIGRFFRPSDDTASAPLVAVLSYAMWQQEFAGASSVLGRKIHLNGHLFSVVGVEPRGFPILQVGTTPELTIPIHADAALHKSWDILHSNVVWWLSVFGRLPPGATLSGANAEALALTKPVLDSIHFKLDDLDLSAFHAAAPRQTFGVISGMHGNREFIAHFDKPLYVLICIALAVLGIGSLNVANLLLARAVARERELAVRLALGAGRMRLIRQMMTESLLLSVLGAALGAVLASWSTHAAKHLIVSSDITLDWRVLAFVAAISAVVTILAGFLPALRGVALGAAALKFGRVGRAFASARLSQLMVCTQLALSLALLSSAFLFSQSFHALLTQDPGFTRKNLVFCGIDTDRSGMNPVQTANFFAHMLDKLRAAPGVSSASLTGIVPLTGSYAWSDLSPKQYPQLSRQQRQLYTHRVSPAYFRTMNIPLLAGRDFDQLDSASKLQSGILSQKAAQLYFPGRSAIGNTLNLGGTSVRITGVVKDASYQSIRDAAPQTLYFDIFHAAGSQGGIIPGSIFLLVRTANSASDIGSVVRRLTNQSGRDVSVETVSSFDQQAEAILVTERLMSLLAIGFATIGCLLAAVGLYGMIAYSVTRRTPEIGVRMALGANRNHVVATLVGQIAKVACLGIGAGVAIAILTGHLVSGLLYRTRPVDPLTLAATIAVLLAVVALAGSLPAIRAARIDPVEALRWD